jgi:hypothetical protein
MNKATANGALCTVYAKGGFSDVDSLLQPLSTLSHVEDIWFENKRT